MKEKKLIIIGAGGHGKVIADIAIKMNRWESIAFLDDDLNKSPMGLKVIGKATDAGQYKEHAEFFVAVGNNATRKTIQEQLEKENIMMAKLIHPQAVIGMDVKIGDGTAIMAGVVINSSTQVGKGCIINTACSVDHDNDIENYVHLSPGVRLGGSVKVGKKSWLGIGSVVINNINICNDCIIGAGAVVIKNITEPGTYVGNPAINKKLKSK